MFDSGSKLKHLPFFEEIAALDETSDAWRTTTAGLLTLRLVDAWIEAGAGKASDDEWNFKSVCAAVDNVSERSPMLSLLSSILFAIREGKPNIRVVVPSMMAYAKALEWESKWSLAADVYQTLLSHLHPIEDSEASMEAHLKLGFCYRTLNDLEGASAAYAAASEIGSASNDMVGILRARIGEGSLARLRGNLPQAVAILDDTIALATGPQLREVRARALNERSGIAMLSGNYELGIRLAYDAIGQTKNQTERDRILNNIAFAFMSLGVYSAARDAFLVLTVTAQEQYMRWAATINLLDVASLTGSQVLFEQHQRELASAPLDPFLATSLELTVGMGYQRLSETSKAIHHFTRAISMASEHRLSQLLIEAEQGLSNVDTKSPLPRNAPAPTPDIEEVATALRELRESVGVG
jgi:tetratricopeptide (TPR) repeat protein